MVNNLTGAETERLAILNEECAEVQQIISKILRFGYESWHPNDTKQTSNRQLLEKEIGDLQSAIDLMTHVQDVDEDMVQDRMAVKPGKRNGFIKYGENQR